MKSQIGRWHGGQLLIAWVLLGIGGIAIIAGWFTLLGTLGHTNWPIDDRVKCLRSVPKQLLSRGSYSAIVDGLYSIPYFDHDKGLEITEQLRPGVDSTFWLTKGYKAFQITPATDTVGMMNDLVRFQTYRLELDTLVQNGYLSARGLRLNRNCVTARYAAVDRRLGSLNVTAAILLLAIPFFGLWMTWVWFAARRPESKS